VKEGRRGVNGRKEDRRKEIESIVYEGELFASSFSLYYIYLLFSTFSGLLLLLGNLLSQGISTFPSLSQKNHKQKNDKNQSLALINP